MPYPRRGVRKFRPRARRAWAVPSVPWAAPTLTTTGTFASETMGVDRFGRVLIGAVPAAGPTTTGMRVYRSADNVTFVDVSANCTITNPSGSNWLIVDKRPQRGSQAVALGDVGYYKIAATATGAESLLATSGAFTIDVDVPAFEAARFAKLHTLISAQAGGYYPSAASEPYPGYQLGAMARAYMATIAADPTTAADYLADCNAIWTYRAAFETTEHLIKDGRDATVVYRDTHFREMILATLAATMLRAAGETTLSATILAKVDVWGKAAIDRLARTSITRRAWLTSQPVWAASGVRAVGDLVVPTVSNGFAYVCTTAGTSGGTQPTWTTTDNATVTDGTAVWTKKAVTGGVFNDTYSVSGSTYTGSGSNNVDTNQNLESVVAYALLMAESTSSFYSAGAYRTAAQTILDDNLNLSLLYQVNDGRIPVGDPTSSYDTNYGSYAMQLAALTASLLGTSYHPSLSRYIAKGMEWLKSSTYWTEPLAQVQWDGPTFTDVSMIARRHACASLMGIAIPPAAVNLIYTTAFQDPATEKWGNYAEFGVTSPQTDQVQARQFEADVFFYGAQVSQTLAPTGIASTSTVGTPTLTLPVATIVPPTLSDLIAASHTIAVLVEVLENGLVVAELDTVIDGTVTLDQTAASRGRCDIALVDDGSLGLVPSEAGDLLAPYGNELRISRGIRYPDLTTEYVRLGVFRIETATVDDTPGNLLIRLAGLDRSARIIDARFEEPYQVTAGTNYTTAIQDVIAAAYPDVVTDLTATARTTPQLIAQEGDDRWAFAQDMARAIGMALYFDGDGTLILRPVSAAGQTPVATLAEGEDGLLVQASRAWSRLGAFNRVIATGENTGLAAPARGVATDDNPLSPTYYYGDFGKVPRFYASPFITTDAQAEDAAQAILARELGTTESVDFGTIVNPELKPDDVVRITRVRAGVDEDHVLDAVVIPLTAEGVMTGKTRAIQVTA